MPLKRGHFELRVLEGSQPGLGHHAITTLLQETGSNTGSLIELASRDFLDVIVPLRVRQTKHWDFEFLSRGSKASQSPVPLLY